MWLRHRASCYPSVTHKTFLSKFCGTFKKKITLSSGVERKKERENCSQTIHQTRPSIVRGVKDGLFTGCLNLLCPPLLFYLTADFERMTLVAVFSDRPRRRDD